MNDAIYEMSRFIVCSALKGGADANVCIDRIAANIDEEFLKKQAHDIIHAYNNDKEFHKSLKKLSSICNKDYQKCTICPVRKYCNTYIISLRRHNEASFKMIDLFCGAGGLSLGFTQEGFVTELANDIEPCCIETYAFNHPETSRKNIVLGDINTLVENINDYIGAKSIDIVVGGPPCQGFSMANRQRLIDDPRNQLYKSFVQVVEKVNPPFFVMENVKGMLSVSGQVIEDFRKLGYETSVHTLNAKDFGIPQNRERLIYIGNRVGVDNEKIFDEIFEYANGCKKYVLKDALFGLRPLKASRRKNSTEIDTVESGNWIEPSIKYESNDYI